MAKDLTSEENTPIIRQYFYIKNQHQDALVFFRIGDFYELFYNDAKIAAKELGIHLTKKNGKNSNIPLAGVPYHSYENYLARLIKLGYKVAICEQLESPAEAKKQKKDIVERAVVRIVTPGTVTEESLLLNGDYNYLAVVHIEKKQAVVAWVDISTGDFWLENTLVKELTNVLYRISPKEILIDIQNKEHLLEDFHNLITPVVWAKFNLLTNQKIVEESFKITIGNNFKPLEVIAIGVLLDYLSLTQKMVMPQLSFPKLWNSKDIMRLDFFTRNSLELTKQINGDYNGSLRSVIDKTLTKVGGRLLQSLIDAPLVDVKNINIRLDCVEYFVINQLALRDIRESLQKVPDITRLFTKLILNRGGPKDLFYIKEALGLVGVIRSKLLGQDVPALITESLLAIGDCSYLESELNKALLDLDSLPVCAKNGHFVKLNYSEELKLLKQQHTKIREDILELETKYTLATNLNNGVLKVQHNNILGFFLEVSSKNAAILLKDSNFIHKQTLVNNVRFTTSELMQLESALFEVKTQIDSFEEKVFIYLINSVLEYKDSINKISQAIALIDCVTAFATLAIECNWVRPIVAQDGGLEIIKGWHPVVAQGLKIHQEKHFVANDCSFNQKNYIAIITGPNMAGKSTFLRQNALIIILAQIGCYVPAQVAKIEIVDAIYSRVGAGDNLYQGQSTFMVEMLETATILNNATRKSFIILDEIGRGTATYDGIALAYAILHYLHDFIKAKVIFSTHYHELTNLDNILPYLRNYYIQVKEDQHNLVFMYKVVPGSANKSYGIHAAKLAGVPSKVIIQAQAYLNKLESINPKHLDLPLFNQSVLQDSDSQLKIEDNLESNNYLELVNTINAIDIDDITPKIALETLYLLKDTINNQNNN